MIRRRKKQKQFTQINNQPLRAQDMSLQAKGLLGLMMSLPEDWVFHQTWLVKQSTNGRDATRTALKELEKHRYVVRRKVMTAAPETRFAGWEWLVDDEPILDIDPDEIVILKAGEELEKPNEDGSPRPGAQIENTDENANFPDLLETRLSGNHKDKPDLLETRLPGIPSAGKSATTNTDLTNTEKKEEKTRARGQTGSGHVEGTPVSAQPNTSSSESVAIEIDSQSLGLPVSSPSESGDDVYSVYWDDRQQAELETLYGSAPAGHTATKPASGAAQGEQAQIAEQEEIDPALEHLLDTSLTSAQPANDGSPLLAAPSQENSPQPTGGQAHSATDRQEVPPASEKRHESQEQESEKVNARLQQLTNRRWLTPQGNAPAWIDEVGPRGIDRHRIAHEVVLSRLEAFWDEAREEVAAANRENRNTPKAITLLIKKLEAHLCTLDELHREMRLMLEADLEPAPKAPPPAPTGLQVGDIVQYDGAEAEIVTITPLGIELMLPGYHYVTLPRSSRLEVIDTRSLGHEEIDENKMAEYRRIALNEEPKATSLEVLPEPSTPIQAAGD